MLQERGFDHEADYFERPRQDGLTVVKVEAGSGSTFDATVEAMRTGTDVVEQATLQHGRWFGRADILRRITRPSELGGWSYEVVDTKLAQETRAAPPGPVRERRNQPAHAEAEEKGVPGRQRGLGQNHEPSRNKRALLSEVFRQPTRGEQGPPGPRL